MVAFYSELGQHGRLSIQNLDSMVGFLFWTWATWWLSIQNLDSMVGFLFWTWAAWSAFYSGLGQHGRLSILDLGSMVG